jgi:hypothetical protein
LFLALLKTFFFNYFRTLFRVFFNSSLRQSQLTDQLIQAKLPSLLFNIFFACTAGIFIYILVENSIPAGKYHYGLFAVSCIISVGIIYLVKNLVLKGLGAISGFKEQADIYLFIIFLINKILGIFLLPVVIFLVFSPISFHASIRLVTFMVMGIMFLLRFYRSYSLLQRDLKMGRFHFFLFLAGLELVPLLVIYKAVMVLLDKNV